MLVNKKLPLRWFGLLVVVGIALSAVGYWLESTDSASSNRGLAGTGSRSAGAGGSGNCSGTGADTTSYSYGDNVAPSQSPPGGLAVNQVPMFVTIGWDDNPYSGLQGSGGDGGLKWAVDMIAARKNPDGSPVHMSFYLTSIYIGTWMSESPVYVKKAWREAYDKGNEIGVHTHTHPHGGAFSLSQWDTEIQTCIDWLTKPFDPSEPYHTPNDGAGIGIPRAEIYGFRTPFLEYNDATFQSVKGHQLWYDVSIQEGYQYDQDGTNFNWPFTLDNGSPGHDVLVKRGVKEPITTHAGLWEMPAYPVIVPPDDIAAQYGIAPGLRAKLKSVANWFDTDSAKIPGYDYNLWVEFKMTKAEVLATLKYTLDLRLQGNRAPFIFGAHTDYYSSKYTVPPNATVRERQEAIEEFIDYALSKREVRVVSVKELLDWVRSPRPLGCQ
jgi:peptidoglycan/xylan/chitin deacetylase (PgdA/CDA1 family)